MTANDIVNKLLESTGMVVQAVLTPKSQRKLLQMVPPVHPNIYAHHVTMAFNPDLETLARYQPMEGQRVRIPVVAVAVDDKAQAVLVGAESENEYAHITISTADGVGPVYSNDLLASADHQHVPLFTLEANVVIGPIEESKPV